jgi:hypothetical protein
MKAQIKCPHCGRPITIRQLERVRGDLRAIEAILDAAFKKMDEAFAILGKAFK